MSLLNSASFRFAFSALVVVGAVGSFGNSAAADPIDPLDPALAPFTLLYGDFNVISLQFADTALNTNKYYVASSPGIIRPDIVVATGAGGNFANDGVTYTQIDQPYGTPSGVGGLPYFRTGNALSGPDPTPTPFPGDTANTWDANLTQLNAALNGGNAVFYFNLNENGVDDQISGTDELVWAKVTVIDQQGILAAQPFYLAGNPFDFLGGGEGKAESIALGGPNETIAPTDQPSGSNQYTPDHRWTFIHGDICVNGSAFVHYGKCTGALGEGVGAQSINQNLGANQAAFAAYNLTLDNLIRNPCIGLNCYDYLQIDFRLTGLNNGFEQLFITSIAVPQGVPEPGTLALLGSGLLGLIMVQRRRRKPAAKG